MVTAAYAERASFLRWQTLRVAMPCYHVVISFIMVAWGLMRGEHPAAFASLATMAVLLVALPTAYQIQYKRQQSAAALAKVMQLVGRDPTSSSSLRVSRNQHAVIIPSACSEHTISMQSACNRMQYTTQSACNQHAIASYHTTLPQVLRSSSILLI